MSNESPDNDVTATDKTVPATANSGAIATMGLQLQEGRVIPRKQVFSWALWDWANQPFNTVILTFIFTALYLTTDVFIDPSIAALGKDDPAYDRAIAELISGLDLDSNSPDGLPSRLLLAACRATQC